ncbi:Protein GrpE [termite gut metagenome]|uniref:Protein GrpE n=1 Tax=termite gut metagenome TaxID=433724 RepID=A0A5J4SA29_9ZZZZ
MKANPFKKTPNMDSKEREIVQEEELRDEQPEQELFEEEKTSTSPASDGNPENNEKTAIGGDSETFLTEEEKLIRQLEEVNALIKEQKDKYLRLSAEFDNYRKRTIKEKAELIFNGGEKTIHSILPVIDDMERALKTMEISDVAPAIQEGIELIYNKFISALGQNGVKIIETKDKLLDTDFHEAIAVISAPSEEQKGKILDCVQTGYTLNDKVIRHAKVVVGE